MAENPDPPAPSPEPPDSRPVPALNRRPSTAERQVQGASPPPGVNEQLAELQETVRALAQHVVGEAPASTEFATDRSGRRMKRFNRSGPGEERAPRSEASSTVEEAPEAEPVESAAVSRPLEPRRTDAAEFNKSVAWPRVGQAEAAEAEAGTVPKRKRANKKAVLVLVQLIGAALLAGGYLVGRNDAPAAAARESEVPNGLLAPVYDGAFRINEKDLETINTALHTARTGDKAAARRLLKEAVDQHLAVPGLHYQIARLALAEIDPLDTDIQLDRSTKGNEFVAAACYTRARFAGAKNNYTEVARQFQAAAYSEPFNGRYFFYWAEALRRMGNAQRAISALEMARDRARSTAEDGFYLFKERLAQAESGHDEAFNAEVDAHLKEQPAPGEWLMLAAARSIADGKNAAAAPFLREAANALPPATYNLWIKDFLFQTARDEPALTALLRRPPIPDSTEVGGLFLDPTIGPPELMDPAIWPVGVAGQNAR